MPISLFFSDKFPVTYLQGYCVTLSEVKGVYTLGRSPENGPVLYDINVPVRIFSKDQAVLTFSYNAALKIWTVADAGLNRYTGELVGYKYQAAVNGTLIPRLSTGIPDPVAIDPNSRILIGGDLDLRILVVSSCDFTSTCQDPFSDIEFNWGIDNWQKSTTPAEISKSELIVDETVDDPDEKTVGLDITQINNPYIKTAVMVSTAAGEGLVNKQTRAKTVVSLLLAFMFSLWALLMALLLKMESIPWIDAPKPGESPPEKTTP